MPCPNGVSIPMVLNLMNEIAYWGERGKLRIAYFYDRMAKTQEDLSSFRVELEERLAKLIGKSNSIALRAAAAESCPVPSSTCISNWKVFDFDLTPFSLSRSSSAFMVL